MSACDGGLTLEDLGVGMRWGVNIRGSRCRHAMGG